MMNSKPLDISVDDYIMGRTSAEYQRLRLQAKILEPATRRILQQIGLQPGMRCLDVGCGPGEGMRLMGEMVSPSGHVTGLDVDSKLGREMLEILRATAKGQFAFIEGNIEEIEDIAGQPFDVTFARLLLIHLPDPIAVLRKMYKWTKPGGYIIIQDYDCRTIDIYPKLESWTEFERVWFGVCDKGGRDARIGHKLPAHFVEADIGSPDGTDVFAMVTSLEQANPMIQGVYRSVLPRALQFGLTTEAKSQVFFEKMNKAPGERYYSFLWPLLVGVWKRKI